MNQNEELLKQECRENFSECRSLAANESISLSLFLWLKTNYENLVRIQRWGENDVETEFLWDLEEDAGYSAIYFEENLWRNSLMPVECLLEELDHEILNANRLSVILENDSCPESIVQFVASISIEDYEWEDEENAEALVEAAQELLAEL
jgi:hypothetical protein